MTSPVICDYCEAVQPSAGMADHYSLFGLEPRYDLDESALHERYVRLSRHAHPDYHVDETPEVQTLHLNVAAALNEAYRTLADPVRRAGYLLTLLGGPSSADDKSVPDGFLGTMMMMQEELEEARESGDQGQIERLRHVLKTQHDGLLRRVSKLFEDLEHAVGCEAVRQDLLGEIRRQLNAISYVRKLQSMTDG